jgi:hypothetical protein
MAETKESRKTPRKAVTTTPKPDTPAAAPRKPTSEQRAAPASTPMSSNLRPDISSEETRRQIAEAAYYRAKERGFEPGHELEDWIEAESEVMGRINGQAR